MRITAGELHGRVLQSVRDKNVRPTSSKTREALFNILGSVENFKVLDCMREPAPLALRPYPEGQVRFAWWMFPASFCGP